MAHTIKQLVSEVHKEIQSEQFKDCSCEEIETRLAILRQKLWTGMSENLEGDFGPRRIELSEAAELTGIPKNTLILYFLNGVKNENIRNQFEYRLGHIYFN